MDVESRVFPKPRIRIAGDKGMLVEYGDEIDPAVNRKVRAVTQAVDDASLPGIVEVVPTYRSILVFYDPMVTTPERISEQLETLERHLDRVPMKEPETLEIPVLYGGEAGPDLDSVARHHGLSREEVIGYHSEQSYQIYMIGFTPGFAFLGGLDERIATPRHATPRSRVPAGSVGIANRQTGIYPIASPGGWQIIGRTPLRLFDPSRENPFYYHAGDRIRFRPIGSAEFEALARGKAP